MLDLITDLNRRKRFLPFLSPSLRLYVLRLETHANIQEYQKAEESLVKYFKQYIILLGSQENRDFIRSSNSVLLLKPGSSLTKLSQLKKVLIIEDCLSLETFSWSQITEVDMSYKKSFFLTPDSESSIHSVIGGRNCNVFFIVIVHAKEHLLDKHELLSVLVPYNIYNSLEDACLCTKNTVSRWEYLLYKFTLPIF